jgi:hypothetical protein
MLIEAPLMTPSMLPAKPKEATEAEIYRRAAEVIERDGWTRGVLRDQRDRVCILGAIGRAVIELSHTPRDPKEFSVAPSEVIDNAEEREALMRWNDEKALTSQQVVWRLERMARKAERRTQ